MKTAGASLPTLFPMPANNFFFTRNDFTHDSFPRFARKQQNGRRFDSRKVEEASALRILPNPRPMRFRSSFHPNNVFSPARPRKYCPVIKRERFSQNSFFKEAKKSCKSMSFCSFSFSNTVQRRKNVYLIFPYNGNSALSCFGERSAGATRLDEAGRRSR